MSFGFVLIKHVRGRVETVGVKETGIRTDGAAARTRAPEV